MSTEARQPDIPPRENRQTRQIHDLLRVGFRPERVAQKLRLPLAQVLAAAGALDAVQPNGDDGEAARNLLLLTLRVEREEALEAWEQSKEKGEETVTVCETKDGKSRKTTHKTRKHSGDPRYLDRITRTVAVEARLRGLNQVAPGAGAKGSKNAKEPPPKTSGEIKTARAKMAMQAADAELMQDHPEIRVLRERYYHRHIVRMVRENTPLLEDEEIGTLLDLMQRYIEFQAEHGPLPVPPPPDPFVPLSALTDPPIKRPAAPPVTPPAAPPVSPPAAPSISVPVAPPVSPPAAPPVTLPAAPPASPPAVPPVTLSPAPSVSPPAAPPANPTPVKFADDEEEDQDEDEYLTERYGVEMLEFLRSKPLAPAPAAKRTLPGPPPQTGGPPPPRQTSDTS